MTHPPRRRPWAIAAGIATICLPLLLGAGAAAAAGHGKSGSAADTASPPAPADLPPTYDLASAAGGVSNFGGAGYYGQLDTSLAAPIVGMATTPDGRGYWLVASDGGVFAFGDARFRGSTGGEHLNAPIVGMASTPDGRGYWLVASDGGIFAFGDARFRGSTGSEHLNAPVVGMAATADGFGYWLVASDGGVFVFGDAHFRGSTGSERLNAPVVGMAARADAGGYWLVASDGGVFAFGDAHSAGSAAGQFGAASAVGIAATPDGRGYWVASSGGRVLAFGDALFRGDVAKTQSASTTAAIAQAPPVTVPPPGPYPAGSVGYDVNWPQCSGPNSSTTVTMPGPPAYPAGTSDYAVAVVGVDGWAVDDTNPCLSAEVTWAEAATATGGASYDLYMLLNSPASTSTIDWQGPAGDCHKMTSASPAWQRCLAYNYGWNSAQIAETYAASEQAKSQIWWLDIENTSCSDSEFNGGVGAPWSCDTALNDLTLQGAVDALHGLGITVGVYSTYMQWAAIMGAFVPHEGDITSIPLWVAGAPWTSPPYPSGYESEAALAPYCAGQYDFANGTPWLLQETPGDNNYPFDPDYACGGEPINDSAVPRGN
jgi:hypothetical protein